MFSKHSDVVLQDLSPDLRDQFDWKVGSLRQFDFPLNITALAIEPIAGLLAAGKNPQGTASGDIHIFGQPGVQSKCTLSQHAEVRLLQFSIPTSNIICLDSNNQLHVYSLLEYGRPKLVASARFDQTISMTLSPSHSHVFLTTHNGEIKTYDLTCLRKSPYSTPNLWKLYEDKLEASGMPSMSPRSPPNAIEVVIHPRNLDLMFVAYAGGVILTDLSERSTIRAYELTLPPGAPGGSGYGMDDILTHRRMMVTSLAIHPSGHLLAIGHADGSISFWAAEDDNKPLVVRTLDTIDVNIVHAELLETHLSSPGQSKGPKSLPEPIFKLSWSSFAGSSDPRGGETTLAVLGGANAGDRPGVTTFVFPAFNPPEPPSDQAGSQNSLHPFFRNAMCQSLSPKHVFFYETQGIVHDYLLLPRSNPHFAGNFDPYAILLITESKSMKTVEAYEYPPPGLIRTIQAPAKVDSEAEDEEDAASSPALLSPQPPTPSPISPQHLNDTPRSLRPPAILMAGHSGILDGTLLKLPNDVYQEFVGRKIDDPHLDLKGGQAYPDPNKMNELKMSKFQPRRVLVTYNLDLSIRFFDFSTQLLIPNGTTNCVEHEWPEPIPSLTIRLGDILDDADIFRVFGLPMDKISIQSVHVASETLEIVIVMKSGEVVVYHPASTRPAPLSSRKPTDNRIVMLDHCQPRPGSRLVPYFMFVVCKDSVDTCALSDTGFLATSYGNGSLYVIDMRGPRIILSRDPDAKKNRHSSIIGNPHLHGHSPSPDIIKSLTWTIAPITKDTKLNIRLIAGLQSGHAEVYTLTHSGNPPSWSTSTSYTEAKVMPDPIPGGIFVLDASTGTQAKANRTRLSESLKGSGSGESPCVMISVGSKGAWSVLNITGDKVAKADWGTKNGLVRGASIIEHADSQVLVVQTDRHDALIYSLPHLEYLHTLQLPSTSPMPLTIDESGDLISWTISPEVRSSNVIHAATYGTFFDVRRQYGLPDIDFTVGKATVPPQPQPVPLGPTSVLGSWFTFNQSKTGEQIDEILGGPDRPIPVKAHPAAASGDTTTASGFVASAAAVQANLYNRLTSAMSERGQMLGDLEERFKSLEEGSSAMVAQAKRLATQQTAKSWFGF